MVIVRVPRWMSHRDIQSIIERHSRWIERKLREWESRKPIRKHFAEGEKFLFLGNEYPLKFASHQRKGVIFDGSSIIVKPADAESIRRRLINWYKEQAKPIIPPRVRHLADIHGFTYSRIRITSARKRWGSCSPDNSLNFSYRLIMAPPEVIDYVIIHELVHTRIKNHSQSFYRMLKSIMPDYREKEDWLHRHWHLTVW